MQLNAKNNAIIAIAGDVVGFDVSTRIKELRLARGLSTNKLSNAAGLSQIYVRKLENGECSPTIASLELLCQALGVSFKDFINYSEASLLQLRAINLLWKLNDDQLEGLCKLLDNEKSI